MKFKVWDICQGRKIKIIDTPVSIRKNIRQQLDMLRVYRVIDDAMPLRRYKVVPARYSKGYFVLFNNYPLFYMVQV